MTVQGPPAGWHPDPSQPGVAMRWWDGIKWTEHTQALPAAAPMAPVGFPGAQPGLATAPPFQPAAPRSFIQRNRLSMTAFVLVVVYLVVATVTHFVIVGFLPLFFAVRALRLKEALAPVALVMSIITMVIGVTLLVHG